MRAAATASAVRKRLLVSWLPAWIRSCRGLPARASDATTRGNLVCKLAWHGGRKSMQRVACSDGGPGCWLTLNYKLNFWATSSGPRLSEMTRGESRGEPVMTATFLSIRASRGKASRERCSPLDRSPVRAARSFLATREIYPSGTRTRDARQIPTTRQDFPDDKRSGLIYCVERRTLPAPGSGSVEWLGYTAVRSRIQARRVVPRRQGDLNHASASRACAGRSSDSGRRIAARPRKTHQARRSRADAIAGRTRGKWRRGGLRPC